MAWHRDDTNLNSAELFPELELGILQVAEHYKQLPDAVESMDSYWFNRTITLLKARAEHQNNEAKKK